MPATAGRSADSATRRLHGGVADGVRHEMSPSETQQSHTDQTPPQGTTTSAARQGPTLAESSPSENPDQGGKGPAPAGGRARLSIAKPQSRPKPRLCRATTRFERSEKRGGVASPYALFFLKPNFLETCGEE